MCFNELLNVKPILNSILPTVLIIFLSFTNLHKGLPSHIEMSDIHNNGEFRSSIKTNIILADNAFGNFVLPTFENQHNQQFEIYNAISSNLNSNVSHTYNERTEKVNRKQSNISLASNANEQLFSRHATHSFDLVNPNIEGNIIINNSNTILNNSALNKLIYFGTKNSTIITTQVGATAHLSCLVYHIGECVVSWIRKKDFHLLTVGLTTYSSDERFSATHLGKSEDWTLHIRFVQQHDAGVYECQVSTHPPRSIFLHLLIVEARVEIFGPTVRYITPGSTLRLQCHVVKNTQKSEFIFWYHNNRMINYDGVRGINVSTESDFQSSELLISRTQREHSGNYTCIASNTKSSSVLVHIFKGDNPAAMYHGHVGSSTKSYQIPKFQFITDFLTTICALYAAKNYGI